MLNVNRIASQLRSTDAAEIAEAALVLPLVFMMLLGIVWFGRAFNIYSTIQQAAQQGALAAARENCATCGSPALPNVVNVENAVSSVLNASSLPTGQIKQAPNPGLKACPAPAPTAGGCSVSPSYHLYVCSSVLLNSASQPAQCGSMVTFEYPFQFYLPFTSLNMSKVIMTAEAQSRMEN